MGLLKQYISEEGKQGILNFKYQGGSVSIVYQYFWSPFCDWIVKYLIPSFIAPNLITLTAFVFVILAHACLMYTSFDFSSEIPQWASLLMAAATLTYQILDNCDGKQARATKSSSPLGMLFDHGCDSIVTWLFGMGIGNSFFLTNRTLLYWCIMILCLIPFYAAQWSQYHVGVFKLGRINAIDEGLILVCGVFLATGLFGQNIWRHQVFGIEIGPLALTSVAVMGVLQFFQFLIDTFLECKKQKKSFTHTLSHLWCVLLLVLTHYTVFTGTDISTNPQLFTPYLYGLFLSWSKVTSHIQIAHITQEKFNQWRLSFMMICGAYIGMVVFGLQQYQAYVVYSSLAFSFICYAHLVYEVTNTMANVLKIKIFRLTPKAENVKKQS